MKEKTYTIGEVSKITGVSKDTLRFYDRIGLFSPKTVNKKNGYRQYTYDQFWEIDIISCCRKLNIPLTMIREILKSKDNTSVLERMMEYQKEARRLSKYYEEVAEDLSWYHRQQLLIENTEVPSEIKIKTFPEKKVLYAENQENIRAYHLKLQQLCKESVEDYHSFRRQYGFILEPEKLYQNRFMKIGEYIEYLKETKEDKIHTKVVPAGVYACCVVRVVNEEADFGKLIAWMDREKIRPKFVVAEEIGLQLFPYLEHGYLCEVRVLLDN